MGIAKRQVRRLGKAARLTLRSEFLAVQTRGEGFTEITREVARCHQLGCNGYIQKPVDFEQFVWAVKQVGLYWLVLNHPRTA